MPTLYHYFSPEGKHLKSLSKREIWFSSAAEFNDPFDFAVLPDFSNIDSEAATKWFHETAAREMPNSSRDERFALIQERKAALRTASGLKAAADDYIALNHRNLGVFSLTKEPANLLMWAHYGRMHTGFCVGLDLDRLRDAQDRYASQKQLVIELNPIKYLSHYPRIDFFEMMLADDSSDRVVDLMLVKSREWIYENEVRMMAWGIPNQPIEFPIDVFGEVVIGHKMKSDKLESLHRHLDMMKFAGRIKRTELDRYNFRLLVQDA